MTDKDFTAFIIIFFNTKNGLDFFLFVLIRYDA